MRAKRSRAHHPHAAEGHVRRASSESTGPTRRFLIRWRKHPRPRGGYKSGDRLKLGKGIPLRYGAPVSVPFALPLPADAPPTGSAVHSTLMWFLEASMMYAKWTQGIEKVRRQIVVVNA